jgi:chromate transporter
MATFDGKRGRVGVDQLKKYGALFLTFAKIGVLTFGGGMAMLPMLQREVVERKSWATEEELADYYAIGQCTPGIIAVNTATFVGQKRAGALGGIAATAGVVFPSLVILSLLAGLIQNFQDLPLVKHAFAGIRVCVCVLIFNAVLKLLKKSVVDKGTAAIFVLVLAGSLFWNLSPAIFVLLAAGMGIFLKRREGKAT